VREWDLMQQFDQEHRKRVNTEALLKKAEEKSLKLVELLE